MKLNRKLRMGMVGGGRGAFIGAVHRMAANLDGQIELVAGCFSSDPKKSRLSGQDFYLDLARVYASYEDMAAAEAALPADQRIDFVSIVTRNNTHFAVAKTFLEAGIHVICDKPLCLTVKEARALKKVVEKTGQVFALTHNYTGYPMVKEARDWITSGKLGKILKIVVEYPQGYAVTAFEEKGDGAISNWRMDPSTSGISNCMGDIGTHAHNLAHYITGLEIEEICAELSTFIPGRPLDDDGNCLIRFEGGAKGILFASQISNGDENNLNIRVYGTKGGLEWHQENPNELTFKCADAPPVVHRRGNSYLGAAAQGATRTPFAHPEGFIEAFANVYAAAATAIADAVAGRKAPKKGYDFPTIDDGIAGMLFIETVVKSSNKGARWTKFPKV
ncbi:Gfo/Idh/MocA family protein [Synoicihabitans lomoniglobus]|uniref:Gfo/Idh/MocA family oxidoreductase n=1 Tax=Synoicihabitans lomoniglobus TaxID=2909285 RepID=A0AAE9ZR17_9BACT|nr:Gfo/Idh/MocA family oxidoreductase [Opitutaceae bacterium LMO-M01]WED63615.1 Gfo/Idh/MocA family oxidoreductase [Opitutaceae bacterium LMO-M01]